MSIKYTPVHVCNFCGEESRRLIVGIAGFVGGESGAEICPKCVKLAADATVADGASDGPIKHPASAAYERAEANRMQFNQMQAAQSSVLGQAIGQHANWTHSLNDPGQCHGNDSITGL